MIPRVRAALNSLPCALQAAPNGFVANLKKNELFILIFIPILNFILIQIFMS